MIAESINIRSLIVPTVKYSESEIEKFLARINFDGEIPSHVPDLGKCWEWTGFIQSMDKGSGGYGMVHLQGKLGYVHRYAYEMFFGEIPKGKFVLHACDRRHCVRHLFTGTQKENVDDMVKKGRKPRGENHWSKLRPDDIPKGAACYQAVLTEDNVREIRREYTGKWGQLSMFARRFGVLPTAIWHIVNYTTWKNVE